MRKQTVLEKTAGQVRNGIQDEYEDLYILTVRKSFRLPARQWEKNSLRNC